MFATGQHSLLYGAGVLYAAAAIAALFRARRWALAPLLAGLAVHALYLVGRGWLVGGFYANPIFEGPFFLPWCLAAVAAGAVARDGDLPLAPLAGLAVAFVALAALYAKGAIPPAPKKTTALAAAFFCAENAGHALFYCGAALSLRAALRREGDGAGATLIAWGFVAFSVAQVVGAVWCWFGWGSTFRFGTRHFSSAAIWIAFAAYLHLRFTPGWSERRRALFAVGAAAVTFVVTYGNYLREMALPRVGG